MENVSFFSDLSATYVAFVEAPRMRRYAKLVSAPPWVHVADSEALETALQRLDSLDPETLSQLTEIVTTALLFGGRRRQEADGTYRRVWAYGFRERRLQRMMG
ncbi:unnamed protein product [Symbiodinium sp. KB8]|nr:unnamed protein product [Symbiodinium sp. KB8]